MTETCRIASRQVQIGLGYSHQKARSLKYDRLSQLPHRMVSRAVLPAALTYRSGTLLRDIRTVDRTIQLRSTALAFKQRITPAHQCQFR